MSHLPSGSTSDKEAIPNTRLAQDLDVPNRGSNATESVPVERTSAQAPEDTSWWGRPCGGMEVVSIGLPLVVSTMSWTLMNFIDRLFLTWYNTDAMAAAMPAGTVSFTAICLPMGVASYVGTFVAQYNGAKQYNMMGRIVWQGVWLGVAAMPIFAVLYLLAPRLFVGHGAAVAQYETIYFRVLQFGAPSVVISAALSGFFSGREETGVIMKVDAATSLLNVVLDYVWIFGYCGFPEMGIAGAAMATVVSSWTRVLCYLVLMWRRDASTPDQPATQSNVDSETTLIGASRFGVVSGCKLDWPMMKRLIQFGGPNGLQMFVEMAAFSSYLFLVGMLGDRELAATGLAFNVNQIAFVPLLGLGFAVSVLVGNQIGRKRADLAERATYTALTIALTYAGMMAVLYWLFPGWFLVLHERFADQAEFGEVRTITILLLRYVAIYCVVDAVLIVFVSAIKGAGDTKFVLFAAMVLSPIPVILGWIGIHKWNWDLNHFWTLITMWIIAQGVIYACRFRQGKWRAMKVIEEP